MFQLGPQLVQKLLNSACQMSSGYSLPVEEEPGKQAHHATNGVHYKGWVITDARGFENQLSKKVCKPQSQNDRTLQDRKKHMPSSHPGVKSGEVGGRGGSL